MIRIINHDQELSKILERMFDDEYYSGDAVDGNVFYVVTISPEKLITYYDVDPDMDWFDEGVFFDCGERNTYRIFSFEFRSMIERVLRKMDCVQDWNWEGRDHIEVAVMKEVENNDD